ncbi:MAG: FecR domain-containing protein [Gemmatimonadaceae bacterium]|jgi:ferric-dicitrate binding protein FerR (iron transport regulator)|nr:FecR domain-containing protein [Gemmatimonadaceae bacterium]
MPDDTRDLLPAAYAPEEDALWGQIARVVAGEGQGEGRGPVAEPRAVREAERAWAAAGAARQWQGTPAPDSAQALSAVWRRVQKQEEIPLRVVRGDRVTPVSVVAVAAAAEGSARRRRLVGMGLAAAAAAIAVAVLLPRANPSTPVATATAPSLVELGSATTAPATVWLSDSTQVVLAARSRLSAAPGYGERHREVVLEGEAFVTVAHRDDVAPFRLRAGGAVIEDVGTAFVVRHAPGGGVSVAVTDGVVRVSRAQPGGDTLELGRKGAVLVDTLGGALARLPDIDPAEAVAWSQERFVVRNATLAHVADAVRSRYGVTLSYDDPSLGERKVTADFGRDGAATVAATIAATLGLDLERQGADGFRLRDPSRVRPGRTAAGN